MRIALATLITLATFSCAALAKKTEKKPREAKCRSAFCAATVLRMDGAADDPRTLKAKEIDKVMRAKTKAFEPCIVLARRRDPYLKKVTIEFVIDGKGKVIASRVDGKQKTPLAKCVEPELRRTLFPATGGGRSVASFVIHVVQ